MEQSINILIVEDDMITAADIAMQLTKLGYHITGLVSKAKDAIKYVKEKKPDLVIMDIQLKGVMDGIEASLEIRQELDVPIIFLTANADEVTFNRAKKTFPIAFISKPFKNLDLRHAVALAVNQINSQAEFPERFTQDQTPPFILDDRIFVKEKDRLIKILLDEILFIEAQRSYSKIHTHEKEFFLSTPLGNLEEKFGDGSFLRVHRSYIINLIHIDAIEENKVIIANQSIPVSQSHRDNFLRRIKKL